MTKRQLSLCWVMLAAGLMIALCSAAHRIQSDADYRDVMVLVDWHVLNSLPAFPTTQHPNLCTIYDPLIDSLPGAVVCYGEETAGTLLDQGIIQPAWMTTGAPAFVVTDRAQESSIRSGVDRHGYQILSRADGRLAFQLPDLPEEDLRLLPVAWLDSVIGQSEYLMTDVILRPGGSEFLDIGGLDETLGFCRDQPLMLFQGPTVLGYPGQLQNVASRIKDNNQFFGWVEFDEQEGGSSLAARLAPDVVRIHSIPPEEMVNYNAETAVARYLRAIKERNIRCIYVRPFIRGSILTMEPQTGYASILAGYNRQFFQQLTDGIADAGFNISSTPTATTDKPAWLKAATPVFTTIATGAVVIMLLAMWLPGWPKWVWTALIVLTFIKAPLGLAEPMFYDGVYFGAAIVFPLWGMWWAMTLYQRLTLKLSCDPFCPRRILIALVALAVASLCTIAGGLLIHAAMWDANTMLKIGQFRGVTAALALPVLLFAAYAWKAETLQETFDAGCLRLMDYWQRFRQLWDSPIRYGDVAFIMIAVGALGIVLLRSGNESPLEVLSIETWFRGSLEQLFTVRPRTKELIGHPLFMLFLLSLPWRNRVSLLFGIAGLLGQVSILNTFCHLHTPLSVTIQRVLTGLALGAVSGIVWGVIIVVVARAAIAIRNRLVSQPQ